MRKIVPAVKLGSGVAVVVLSMLFIWIYWFHAYPELILAKLRGESIVVPEPVVDCGEIRPGEEKDAQVSVYNVTKQSWELVGGRTFHNVMITEDLPIELPAGGFRMVRIRLKIDEGYTRKGKVEEKVFFWTNCPDQEQVWFRVEGWVK